MPVPPYRTWHRRQACTLSRHEQKAVCGSCGRRATWHNGAVNNDDPMGWTCDGCFIPTALTLDADHE